MTINPSVRPFLAGLGGTNLSQSNKRRRSFGFRVGRRSEEDCFCMQLTWNEKLRTGVAELDNDHRQLIGLVNDLQSAGNALAQTGTLNKKPIAELLQRLHDHSAAHHEREELLLFQFGHPCLESHRQEHIQLIQKLVRLRARFDACTVLEDAIEIIQEVSDWMIGHFCVTDHKYSEHFRIRNRASSPPVNPSLNSTVPIPLLQTTGGSHPSLPTRA